MLFHDSNSQIIEIFGILTLKKLFSEINQTFELVVNQLFFLLTIYDRFEFNSKLSTSIQARHRKASNNANNK